MAHLKLNTAQWLELGKKLGYVKESQRVGRIVFSPAGESGLHEEDFEEIMKEKDPFVDVQEGGGLWMDRDMKDKDHPHEPAEPGDKDCPCGCGGGPECECWKQNEPCEVGKTIDKLNIDLGEHNKEVRPGDDRIKSKTINRESIHDLIDKIMDIK